MEYRRFENTIIARIDKGEEILEQVKIIAQTEQKIYQSNEFQGDFEIVSLVGTINTMNHEFYCHLHMSAGNEKGEVFGGHLNQAIVSATCEMVISIVNGDVDRCYSNEIGLNLFRF